MSAASRILRFSMEDASSCSRPAWWITPRWSSGSNPLFPLWLKRSKTRHYPRRWMLDFDPDGSQTTSNERNSEAHLFVGLGEGHDADLSLPGSQERHHRAVSPGTAHGGRTLSRRATVEHESRNRGIALYFLQFVRASLPGKFDCSGMAAG